MNGPNEAPPAGRPPATVTVQCEICSGYGRNPFGPPGNRCGSCAGNGKRVVPAEDSGHG